MKLKRKIKIAGSKYLWESKEAKFEQVTTWNGKFYMKEMDTKTSSLKTPPLPEQHNSELDEYYSLSVNKIHLKRKMLWF